MSREWKPGDVALVEAGCWANRKVALRLAEGWAHTNGVNVDGDGVVSPVRPLVVIDPEDREAVERLVVAYYSQIDATKYWVGDLPEKFTNHLQAALREFANPTPPKPDEPTGLGAVVEDKDGVTWVRAGKTHGGRMHDHWRCVDGEHVGYWARWDRLDVARVLSEGVQ